LKWTIRSGNCVDFIRRLTNRYFAE
jgi:hypothetical protein